MKKICFVVNVDWFFVSHREPLATEALKRGYKVFLIAKDTGLKTQIESHGIKFIDFNFERSGKNPFKEVLNIFKLHKLYKSFQPDIIHHITLKPSIYGSIAAKRAKVNSKIINAVSGLGYEFTNNRQSLSKTILLKLMKLAFSDQQSYFIFQNPDDQEFYNSMNFLRENNYKLIRGSGVDENVFGFKYPVRKEKLTVTLLARMLKDKGIIEFIEAAEILRTKFDKKVEFLLIGGIDPENPAHITKKELTEKCDQIYIKWLGHQHDVKGAYEQSDIVCLPSYREGLPKSLIEAMAIGRPIITTDAIGCRECVDEGINGFKVPVKDVGILASKIKLLLLNEDMRLKMGEKSREKMVKEMSLKKIIAQTFEVYES